VDVLPEVKFWVRNLERRPLEQRRLKREAPHWRAVGKAQPGQAPVRDAQRPRLRVHPGQSRSASRFSCYNI